MHHIALHDYEGRNRAFLLFKYKFTVIVACFLLTSHQTIGYFFVRFAKKKT